MKLKLGGALLEIYKNIEVKTSSLQFFLSLNHWVL